MSLLRTLPNISKTLLTVILLFSLSGCKWWLAQPVATKTVYVQVPRSLYPVCPQVERNYNTIGERIVWGDNVAEAYASCIMDVDTLIEYLEEKRSE